MASTLYDYYTSKGQALPSISDRAKLYEQAGLGGASTYQGTAAQNTALLEHLMGGGTPAPATSAPASSSSGSTSSSAPASAPSTAPTNPFGIVDAGTPLDYLSIAKQHYSSLEGQQAGIDSAEMDATKKSIADMLASIQSTITMRQQQYDAAAKVFEDQAKAQMDQLKQQQEQNMGGLVASSDGGILAAQGSARAPLTAEQNKEAADTANLVNNIQDQRLKMLAQRDADVNDLQQQYIKAQDQGNQALIALTQQQFQEKVSWLDKEDQYASAIASAVSEENKMRLQMAMDAEKIRHDNIMEGLAAQRNAISASRAASASMANQLALQQRIDNLSPKWSFTKDAAGNQSTNMAFTDSKGNPITMAQYYSQVASLNGKNIDFSSLVSDVVQHLETYGGADDQAKANQIKNIVTSGKSAQDILATLGVQFREIFGGL